MENIIMLILGVFISVVGIINIKGNISTIHSYNRRRVKEEDIPKYGKVVGTGTLMNIPWWRSHPIHENRATESICTEPCNPLLRATKSMKRATSTY